MKIERLSASSLRQVDCDQICTLMGPVQCRKLLSIHDLRTVVNRSSVYVVRDGESDHIVGLVTYAKTHKLTGLVGHVSEIYFLESNSERILQTLLRAVIDEARGDHVVALDRFRLPGGHDPAHHVFLSLGFRGPECGIGMYRLEL